MKNLMPLMVAATLLLVSQGAYAQTGAAGSTWGWGVGAGLAMGLAALGGTMGQGNAARGYFESVSRNPQSVEKMGASFILGLAFIESLVLFAFVVAFLLQGH
ncbi:MAG: ATP synthase F0 subunit C [Myxococcales bacterium]|nr:ATP synthase F0 subunit C [Myxococcales bacterium]MCB9672926.1 ATP synthase F0 subunit C [Alphaproteobacteria bacterium]